MTTKKTPTPSSQPTKPTNAHPSRKPVSPHSRTPATPPSRAQSQRERQAPAPRPSRRRRPTLRQRIARLSGGSWLAIITGVLVVGIVVFALIASHQSGGTGSSNTTAGLLAPGTTAPAITMLPAADGKSYDLAQYKGQKVVVLEFFAPWCPHCQNETSTLKQIQQDNASKGVQVLSVSASPYGRNYEQGDTTPISMSDIQWFSSNFHLNYPALFDPSLKAGTDYKVQAYPTIYIINKQGVITYAESGEISYDSLQQQINTALSQ
jgi:peroxiredoxin